MRSSVLLFMMVLSFAGYGQRQRLLLLNAPASPYALNWRADAFMAPAGAGLFGISVLLERNKPNAAYGSYSRKDIWRPERTFTGPYRKPAAVASDLLLYVPCALPATLMFDKNIRKSWSFYIMYTEVMAINGGLTYFAKTIANRPRPYAYSTTADPDMVTGKEPLRSFFSGHTSFAAASMFFMAKVYHDHHPKSKWRYAMWSAAAATPLATGALRVRAGKHFPTDVAVGYVVGALTGFGVPWVHQRIQQRWQRKNPTAIEGF